MSEYSSFKSNPNTNMTFSGIGNFGALGGSAHHGYAGGLIKLGAGANPPMNFPNPYLDVNTYHPYGGKVKGLARLMAHQSNWTGPGK